MGNKKSIHVVENIEIKDLLVRHKIFYEKYPKWRVINVIIIILSPIIYFQITGILGLFIGIIIGFLSYFFIPPAVIKVKEKYR